MLLGLRLAGRAAKSASRAGLDRTYVLGGRGIPELPPGRIVLLADWIVATPDWLRRVREAPVDRDRVYHLGTWGGLVETREIASLESALRRHSKLTSVLSEWA